MLKIFVTLSSLCMRAELKHDEIVIIKFKYLYSRQFIRENQPQVKIKNFAIKNSKIIIEVIIWKKRD